MNDRLPPDLAREIRQQDSHLKSIVGEEHKIAVDYEKVKAIGSCTCGAPAYVCPGCRRAFCSRLTPPRERLCRRCSASTCCPFKNRCSTVIYWSREKADFIRDVCDTREHTKCTHFGSQRESL